MLRGWYLLRRYLGYTDRELRPVSYEEGCLLIELYKTDQAHREIFESAIAGIDVSKIARYQKYLAEEDKVTQSPEEEIKTEAEHYSDVLNILNHGNK